MHDCGGAKKNKTKSGQKKEREREGGGRVWCPVTKKNKVGESMQGGTAQVDGGSDVSRR